MRRKPRILVCNDDGKEGPGLWPLIEALRRFAEVHAVVPDRERSTTSHAMTLKRPLRRQKIGEDAWALDGFPADCARFGVLYLMREKVDLVVSGINQGVNLGWDVFYSGTVAAAREAAVQGVDAIAVSQDVRASKGFDASAAWTASFVQEVLERRNGSRFLLNINVPPLEEAAKPRARWTKLARRDYGKDVVAFKDPRGGEAFWMAGSAVKGVAEPGTDVEAHEQGLISVTPLRMDFTENDRSRSLSTMLE